MTISHCHIPDLLILNPKVFADDRGFFFELWNQNRYHEAGIGPQFVQDNISCSGRGALRGLHFQNPMGQGKLVSALEGELFDVAVDLRRRSPTFGRWHGERLSGENKRQMFIPSGFAHGFVVLSETALLHYKCTEYYSPKDEWTLMWNDPDVGIAWPVSQPVLSPKDRQGVRLRELPADRLFA